MRKLHDRHFDYLAGVLFAEDFTVARACLIPAEVVVREAKYIAHTNSWMLHLRDGLWAQDGVQDITAAVRAAALGEAQQGDTGLTLPIAPESKAVATAGTDEEEITAVPITEQMAATGVQTLATPVVTYTFSRFCFKADEIEPLVPRYS